MTRLIKNVGLCALVSFTFVGCTIPVYTHSVITKYDAQGRVIGTEEIESITQANPISTPMIVRITQREKLEK